MSKSRKTTIMGAIAGLAAAATAYGETVGLTWLKEIAPLFMAFAIALLGFFTRDDNVSSEGSTAPKDQ